VGIFCVTAEAVIYKAEEPTREVGRDADSAQDAGAPRDQAKAALFGVELDGA
jgi:hypothetical protein